MLLISFILLTICSWSACYYDVEEEIYPSIECDTNNVTYAATIVPLLQANCYSCHSAAANLGNITIEGYSNLKRFVDNGQLLGSIRHEAGFSAMPKNQPQLVGCNIQKIEQWINDGALNN